MHYTKQEMVDAGLIGSIQDIDDIINLCWNGETPLPDEYKDWNFLGPNDLENRPELLLFPTKLDMDDYLNES